MCRQLGKRTCVTILAVIAGISPSLAESETPVIAARRVLPTSEGAVPLNAQITIGFSVRHLETVPLDGFALSEILMRDASGAEIAGATSHTETSETITVRYTPHYGLSAKTKYEILSRVRVNDPQGFFGRFEVVGTFETGEHVDRTAPPAPTALNLDFGECGTPQEGRFTIRWEKAPPDTITEVKLKNGNVFWTTREFVSGAISGSERQPADLKEVGIYEFRFIDNAGNRSDPSSVEVLIPCTAAEVVESERPDDLKSESRRDGGCETGTVSVLGLVFLAVLAARWRKSRRRFPIG